MTIPEPPTRPPTDASTRTRVPLHRPLVALAAASAVGVVVCLIALVTDPREILGQPVWAKPLKFSISLAVYSVTLAWMIGLATRRRLLSVVGNVVVVALVLEMVVIIGAAITNTTSHFNVSSPAAAAMWSLMAVSIVVVWLATVVVALVLFRDPLGDGARSLAIRAGLVIGLVGMALAFLMTGPTAEQLNDYQGIAGAHAVGVADGGAGIPILGWSTEGGDLRIPHFVGMHALQVLPLIAIGLELLARRVPVLRSAVVRFRLVLAAAIGFAGTVALVSWQALRGQSIVAPDALTLGAVTVLGLGVIVVVVLTLIRGSAAAPDAGTAAPSPVDSVPSRSRAGFR
ncbi:hypothetical protein [Labedella populi]|uniref:hypothetical protein n=1 Tax=Labedella populi TaxID=2498850 RepID=UPI001AA0AD4B|nr:hypothetical protein [Labedella populi]